MKFKKLLVLFSLVTICACDTNSDLYYYNHQQGSNDFESSMYYSDDLFNLDSTIYNPKLASASIAFAMSSFASMEDPQNYKTKSINAENLLKDLGYSNFETNQSFKEKPQTDTIGLLAATKKVKNYTIIAVGIRGAHYELEWASNVTLGNREDGYHQGFYEAANIYLDYLKDYINKYEISGDIKIWTAGYSRAGATCNLASGLLDESIENKTNILGNNIKLTKEHLYSYCFEPPMGAPKTKDKEGNLLVKSSTYNNIFNIINFNDPVPLVAMKELNFTRYGTDIYLPDPINTLEFDHHLKNLNYFYDRLSNHGVLGDYRISKFTYKSNEGFSLGDNKNAHAMTQGLFLKELLEYITVYGLNSDLEYYNNKLQEGLRNIFKLVYYSGNFKGSITDIAITMVNDLSILEEVDYLFMDLLVGAVYEQSFKNFARDLKPIIIRGLAKIDSTIDTKETSNNLTELLLVLGKGLFTAILEGKTYILLSLFNKDNLLSLASGHYPELCECHLKALDEKYTDDPYKGSLDGKYYKLLVYDTDAKIKIYNKDNLIVNINDGEAINNKIPYIKRKSCYEIYLPGHANYDLKLDKETDIELSYFDRDKDDLVAYYDRPVINFSF